MSEVITLHNGNTVVETYDGIDIPAGGSLVITASISTGLLKDGYFFTDIFNPAENIYVTSSLAPTVQLKNQPAIDMIMYGTRSTGTSAVTSVNAQVGDVVIPPAPINTVNGMTGDVVIPPAPVDSVNGQTGVVSINIPVDSVNGMTGAVIIPPAPITTVNGQTGDVVLNIPPISDLQSSYNIVYTYGQNGDIIAMDVFNGSTQTITNRIYTLNLTYTNDNITQELWKRYDVVDGTTILETVTKTYTYLNDDIVNVGVVSA